MDAPSALGVPLWSVLAGAAAVLIYKYLTWNFGFFDKLGLKGPRPLPLLGNAWEFFTKSSAELDLENARKYGKVYGAFNGTTPVLVVGEPDLVKEILVKEFTHFVNRTPFKGLQQKPLDRMMTIISDDHWRHVRASLSPAYSSGKLKQMLPTITGCADNLMAYIEDRNGAVTDAKDTLSGFTMDVISGTAFGLDSRSLQNPDNTFLKNAKTFFAFASQRNPKRMIPVLLALILPRLSVLLNKLGISVFDKSAVDYMESVVRDALKTSGGSGEGRQNFVNLCHSELVDIKDVSGDNVKRTADGLVWTTKGLLVDDIISNSIVFLLAGYDTVSTFLSFFCYAMATNPDVQKKAYDEIADVTSDGDITYDKLKNLHYLDMCMDEALRMYPPALRLDRKCNKAITIGDLHIPEGTTVNIPVYAIHHDPEYWPDPFTFKPERFSPEEKTQIYPCSYLPFGTGPRNCIGMRLALLEAKVAIVNILLKYEIRGCKDTPKPPIKIGKSFGFLTPAEPILLSFKKRQTHP